MSALPTFSEPKVRAACRERMATIGHAPCFEIIPNEPPCAECLRDVGVEPGDDTIDPKAAVRALL